MDVFVIRPFHINESFSFNLLPLVVTELGGFLSCLSPSTLIVTITFDALTSKKREESVISANVFSKAMHHSNKSQYVSL